MIPVPAPAPLFVGLTLTSDGRTILLNAASIAYVESRVSDGNGSLVTLVSGEALAVSESQEWIAARLGLRR